ncbi:MAG: YafY family protein [Bacillus sp. (in: firmicutes)]
MQINRLFEIVYLLLNKKSITAKELSEHFEVSTRTIYRDMDILSAAGIPVYTNRGRGGGIQLLDHFVLNKSLFSDKEQNDILVSLQSLHAANFPDIKSVFNKLSLLFNKQTTNWMEIDLSNWGSNDREKDMFNTIKTAVLAKDMIAFDYFNSSGEKTERRIEPLKLLFKGRGWYLHGFCTTKNDYRLFKISRMKSLHPLNTTFEREIPQDIWGNSNTKHTDKITIVLRFDSSIAYRLYDEFDPQCIHKNADGSFTVSISFPENEWLYGYILSYGNCAEVVEPPHLREIIIEKYQEGLKKYLSPR